eukprot:Hpha_TRINITY_DN22303_c0_g1::TRINITY_DN22303_c0_g1_i1::g.177744::m.177744
MQRVCVLSSHLGGSKPDPVASDLAAACRSLHLWGLDGLSSFRIIVALQGGRYFTSPVGMLGCEVTAESIVEVDSDGRVVSGEGLVDAAAVVALAAVQQVSGCSVVLHTYQRWASVMGCTGMAMEQAQQNALRFAGRTTAPVPLAMRCRADGERAGRLAREAGTGGQGGVVMLQNHGAVFFGGSVAEVVHDVYYFERAAAMQVQAAQTGGELVKVGEGTIREFVSGYVRTGGMTAEAVEFYKALRSDPRTKPRRPADPLAAATVRFGPGGVVESMGDGEWRSRLDLAASYRYLDKAGLNEGICNHLTATVPHPDGGGGVCFLVVPYGLRWSQVTASNLLLIDSQGKVLRGRGVCEDTAFWIHARIHVVTGRHCVLHTHQPAATALCILRHGRIDSGLHAWGAGLGDDDVVYDPSYNGLVLGREEGDRMAKLMGRRRVLMHRAHGVISAADTIAEALHLLLATEEAAWIQLEAMKTRRKLRPMLGQAVGVITTPHTAAMFLEAVKRDLLSDGTNS